jgi:S1-C subfamily serine protease
LGFAIPVDVVVGVATDLIAAGQVDHARLGIRGTTAWAEDGDAEYPVGIGVTDLVANSAYEASGGQINDVIVELEGSPVTTIDQLLARLRHFRAGDTVNARILRVDDELLLDIELGSLDQ